MMHRMMHDGAMYDPEPGFQVVIDRKRLGRWDWQIACMSPVDGEPYVESGRARTERQAEQAVRLATRRLTIAARSR